MYEDDFQAEWFQLWTTTDGESWSSFNFSAGVDGNPYEASFFQGLPGTIATNYFDDSDSVQVCRAKSSKIGFLSF